jgi:hypothetical protein
VNIFADKTLQAFLETLLSPFTHYAYSISAFLILISAAIVTAFWMAARQQSMLRDIALASDAVVPLQTPEEFTAHYGDVNQSLKQNATLRRSWEEFEETLIPPLDDIDDPSYRVFRNTKRPSEFFQSSTLLSRLTPFFKPEDFIGFGLLPHIPRTSRGSGCGRRGNGKGCGRGGGARPRP